MDSSDKEMSGAECDERSRMHLIEALVGCGLLRSDIENRSLLQLIRDASEYALFEPEKFNLLLSELLIGVAAAEGALLEGIARGQRALEEREKKFDEIAHRTSELAAEGTVLLREVRRISQLPCFEEIRGIFERANLHEHLIRALAAGITSLESLRAAARTGVGLRDLGFSDQDVVRLRKELAKRRRKRSK